MVEQIMSAIQMLQASTMGVLGAIDVLLMAVIGICLIIPGDQPEKALQGVVDLIRKVSKKK